MGYWADAGLTQGQREAAQSLEADVGVLWGRLEMWSC